MSKKKLPTGMASRIEERKDIKSIELNGKKFEFDITWNKSVDVVFALALISLNDPRINKIFHTFEIELRDKDNNKIDY